MQCENLREVEREMKRNSGILLESSVKRRYAVNVLLCCETDKNGQKMKYTSSMKPAMMNLATTPAR